MFEYNDIKGQDASTTGCSKKYFFLVKLYRKFSFIKTVIKSLINIFFFILYSFSIDNS